MFVSCDIEDTMGTGKQAVTWKATMLSGWDAMAKEYRGYMVDNMGGTMGMKGKLDGAKLVWESDKEVPMGNQMMKVRVTLDATDPKAIKFTSERGSKGTWTVDETATHKVSGK
jgi:hypothetical protein